ncbi:MAG: TolC family protein [Hylemonella sp.]|uniref:TolC family protein n=1 Tax=Hylemonella sp. TaxID=2066020 RepID=UPI003918841B
MNKTKIWRRWTASLLLCPLAALAQPAGEPPRPAAAPPAIATAADEAGTAYTLEALVQLVLTHNPALQGARSARAQAEAGIRSAGALPNPRLEISDGRQRPNGPTGTSGNITGWGVSQLIENPWLRSARVDAAEQGLRSSEAQLGLTRSEVVAQVKLRAYEVLLRIEESRAADDELQLLEQTRDRVRVRVDSGEAARYEIIKAEAEFISARQRQQTAQLSVEQARIRLNQLAGGQLPLGWTLNARLDDAQPPVQAPLLREQLLGTNPELQSLRAQLERQQARVREASASRWPGVELRYNDLRDPDNRQGMIGASIQIPLLDQKRGPRAEAEAEATRARTRLEARQIELQLQLDSAVMALEMARLRVEALGTGAIRDAEAAVRVAQAAYRFGERGILDVLDAQRVLRTVRGDLLQARYQQQAAAIEIDLLTGRDAVQP